MKNTLRIWSKSEQTCCSDLGRQIWHYLIHMYKRFCNAWSIISINASSSERFYLSNKHCLTVWNPLLIPLDAKSFGYYSSGKSCIPGIDHCKRTIFHNLPENYLKLLNKFCNSVPVWMRGKSYFNPKDWY